MLAIESNGEALNDIQNTAQKAGAAAKVTKNAIKTVGKGAIKSAKAIKNGAKAIIAIVRNIVSIISAIGLPGIAIILVIVIFVSLLFGTNTSGGTNTEGYDDSAYIAREVQPESGNQFYFSNLNPFYASGYGMPNCTAYAYGRAYEILGEKPNLCTGNAEDWFDYNKQHGYYPYGNTPRLGAIAVWSHPDGGHVAVVEKIEDGRVYFSNSAWNRPDLFFYMSNCELTLENASYNPSWTLLGYIYIYTGYSGITVSADAEALGLNDSEYAVFYFFLRKGLSVATTCGLMGNIKQECSFNPSTYFAGYVADVGGASGNSGGICMWYGDNCTRFKRDCPNWGTNLGAQINYLYQTLLKDGQGSPSDKYYYWCTGCWSRLRAVPNTRAGASQAAVIFRDNYERCEPSLAGPREEYAQQYWDKLHDKV